MARIKTPSAKTHQYRTPAPILTSVPLDPIETTEPPAEKDEETPQMDESPVTENLQLENLQSKEDAGTLSPDLTTEEKADSEAAKFGNRPIVDRIDKLNELFALTQKRDKILATKEKLAKFKLSTDMNTDCITLENETDEFKTYNKDIIREVIALIKNRTQEALLNVEAAIRI